MEKTAMRNATQKLPNGMTKRKDKNRMTKTAMRNATQKIPNGRTKFKPTYI
jgi:hypothetical protein